MSFACDPPETPNRIEPCLDDERRRDVQVITGLRERIARTLLGELPKDKILAAKSEKDVVFVHFPVEKRDQLFLRLFAGAWLG